MYERTERRGHVFERLRPDIDAIAALTGMQDVFRLRAADIFRVVSTSATYEPPFGAAPDRRPGTASTRGVGRAGGPARAVATSTSSSTPRSTASTGLLGYAHVHLLLLDEEGRRSTRSPAAASTPRAIGAEVPLGDGVIGGRRPVEPMRVGNVRQMAKYSLGAPRRSRTAARVRPGDPDAGTARRREPTGRSGDGARQLIGVLVVDRADPVAFDDDRRAGARAWWRDAGQARSSTLGSPVDESACRSAQAPVTRTVDGGGVPDRRRYFAVDGSTFFDGDYLIKGVAGRILWTLLRQHATEGRVDFTNGELRLDPSLDLPEVQGQPREPADPAEAASRRAPGTAPHRTDRPRPVPSSREHSPPDRDTRRLTRRDTTTTKIERGDAAAHETRKSF